MMLKKPQHSWWFDSHQSPRRSPWLQATLSELDGKTKSMLKLIEEDADSFAQRAEMYYKKRPELVNMVEDFYRAHRSLAERYNQLKSEPGMRVMTALHFSPLSNKSPSQKLSKLAEKSSETSSDCFDSEESEVDDPEQEETQVGKIGEYVESSSKDRESEATKLHEEIERLKAENSRQKAKLMERNEEKREAIRQLCLALDMMKEENINLRRNLKDARESSIFEFSKWKGLIKLLAL